MAQSTFSEDSKLGPLLGLAADRSNILEATQMTEIYEYAMSLADIHFNLGSAFLRSKFEYVKSLIDFGFTFQGFSYCEVISKQSGNLAHKDDSLRWDLIQVGERLRYADPSNNSDWIQDLRTALLEVQTTDNSETSSRRGSYPPSSIGISSVDQGSPASGPNVQPSENQNLPENVYQPPNFLPNTGFAPDTKGEIYEQSEPAGNNIGAYDPNPSLYEVNQVPLLPTNNTNTYNPNQNQFQNQPNNQFESTQEMWGMQQNVLPQKSQEIPSWESNQPYFTPQQPNTGIQQDGAFQVEEKPYDPSMSAGTNNNIYPPGTFVPPQSSGMENGYPGMDFQPKPHFQPPMVNPVRSQSQPPPLPPTQENNANPKRKTVRFEDDDAEGQGIRMNRSQALSILRRVESDEVTEETSEEDESPKNPPVKFKSTYPIDRPLSHRLTPSSPNGPPLRTSKVNAVKTYPVDRKCCDAVAPCPDHNTSQFPTSLRSAGPNLNSSLEAQPEGQWKGEDKKQDGKNDGKKGSKVNKANTSNTNKGGLLSWLGLRGKNQMILPDDKEPSIVWDEKTKQWVNTKDEDDDTSGPRGPPPKDSELMPRSNAPPPLQQQSGYGNQPPMMQQMQQPMGYAPTPITTVTDGGAAPPSFNPQLHQPVSTGIQNENWGNQNALSQPTSLTYNQNQLLNQSTPGPQSLNIQQQPQQLQPPIPGSNMNKYKLPKSGRGSMRGQYVDVFRGNSGAPPQPMGMAPPTMMAAPMMGNGPNSMFIPSPAPDSEEFPEQR